MVNKSMDVLKFKLSGKSAFFKKPDVNSYVYFTYGNIHKVALLGMFGAILGYEGYNQFRQNIDNIKDYKENYPEFYNRLKDIKISIEPLCKKGVISKKVQVFNNSVGYASQELGGNLIVKEQWLENPSWNIYVLLDNEESNKICEYISKYKSIYQPYLGKNDHYANISDIEIFEDVESIDSVNRIHSLCKKSTIEFDMEEYEENEENPFKYSEKLPIGLREDNNMYILESFVYSNMYVESIDIIDIYNINNKNIVFF